MRSGPQWVPNIMAQGNASPAPGTGNLKVAVARPNVTVTAYFFWSALRPDKFKFRILKGLKLKICGPCGPNKVFLGKPVRMNNLMIR